MRAFLILVVAASLATACEEVTPRREQETGPGPSDADVWIRDGGADIDGSAGDAGVADAGAPDSATPPPTGPRVYPYGRRHSPLDESLAEQLRARVAAHPAQQDDVFAKVGDSITVSTSFMHCFAGSSVELSGRDALMPTIAHFASGDAGGSSPYTRTSLAAGVGWSASAALMGSPSPLTRELDATRPRFASLMYGTNDVGFVDYDAFIRNMTAIADAMLARGVLPILSSIPPRDDNAAADARVPAYGGLVRALALSRGLAFVDYHSELLPLPRHGLAGDGVHPQAFGGGACVFTPAGLAFASNVRNLLVLEALDRLRRVALLAQAAPDADAPRLTGAGSREDPFVVPSLPFSAHGDTRTQGRADVDTWEACSPSSEAGPELRYRVTLPSAATLSAVLSSGAGADLDVHIVRAGEDGAGCLARGNRDASVALSAGSYDVVIDTFASSGGPLPGEGFLFIDAR